MTTASTRNNLGGLLSTALMLLLMTTGAHGLGDKTSDLPLFESTPMHCDEMVMLHRWEGSCCSLNVTNGRGCVLNVMNGHCKVRGQVWTLNYNSTFDKKDCPPSEYTPQQLGMPSPKTEPPISGSSLTIFGKKLIFVATIIATSSALWA